LLKRLLEYVGFEPGRFQARWISGSEGAKFTATIKDMTEKIKSLGPNKKMRDDIV
jgi:coenzyme F420-reducing hydrogenase delta subunit